MALTLTGVLLWPKPAPAPIPEQKYPLLAKRLFLENPNDTLINFVPLRKQIEEKFRQLNIGHSFYFEYLPTGTTVRDGETNELVAASLIKVPFVMDLYRAAELGKVDLDKVVEIEPDTINDQYGDLYKRGVGSKLTLREAAKIALEKSDNTAILIIQKQIRDKFTSDQTAISAVDAEYNLDEDTVLMNSKAYASILKCIYFTCYVNLNDSQEILDYLTNSISPDGIAGPIPYSVKVAHKIGVNYKVLTQSDCGIVYVPKRPYLLCIMLSTDEQTAKPIMQDLSKTVYDYVTRTN